MKFTKHRFRRLRHKPEQPLRRRYSPRIPKADFGRVDASDRVCLWPIPLVFSMLSTVHGLHSKAVRPRGHNARSKSVDGIEVDLGAYSAYEPFEALSTLRKILIQVGHSHLTMRIDHHKLAMHLLGLIEPWVTLSPARNTLSQQPNETLDRVAFYLESQRDLLSLSLCSKR